jgi:glycosyltransferase involved in cell wall biosynthesis
VTQGRGASPQRVALVHDFLLGLRGAERVFLEICDLWPDADIFTPVYNERATEGRFAHRKVHTSFLQKLHPNRRNFRAMLPFFPTAIESFDLSGYDVVVSSSSAWAHAVICGERTAHVCYCHNPFRYAWNERHRALAERHNPVTRLALSGFLRRWREWDWIAAQRVDRYVTNSRTTQGRIRSYLGRESRIVYPPVELGRFKRAEPAGHYLVLSELLSHKRIEAAVEAFARLGLPLIVVGDGPERRRLSRHAPSNIRFAGRVGDEEVAHLLATCRALVQTSVEEFGIAAVEAQAAGRPVIARRAGGALETVVEDVTGWFWDGGSDDLVAAVRGFDTDAIDSQACVENAARFRASVFRRELLREVSLAVQDPFSGAEAGDRELRARARRPGPRVRLGRNPLLR